MMNFALLVIMSTTMNVMFIKNPVKSAMAALILSTSIFLTSWITTGTSWLPSIMYLMFMGGILIMFMILSSVMPNEKAGSLKWTFFFIAMTGIPFYVSTSTITPQAISSVMASQSAPLIMTSLILMYFFSFLASLKEKGTPIRNN